MNLSLKKKCILCVLALLIFLPTNVFAQLGKSDTQLWSEIWLYAPKFNDHIDLGYTNYTRIGRDVSKITDERQGIFATYIFMPEFKITQHLLYMESSIPNANLNSTTQIRPMTEAHGAFDLDSFKLTYRLRAEKQFRDDFPDRWNFRPRVGFEIPFKWGDYTPYAFANTEAFYTSDKMEWFRLRNLYGFGCAFTKSINLDVFMGEQLQRNPSQTDFDLFGFILRIRS